MTTSHTLSIAIDEPFTFHRIASSVAETLQRQALTSWDRFGHLLQALVSAPAQPLARPVSGYYLNARDSVRASVPVTSLRPFA